MNVGLNIREGIAHLTLQRSEALNALNEALMGELEDALARVETDDNARALVIRGAGRAFCAGSDLKDLDGAPVERAEHLVRREAALCRRLEALPQPTIAAIHGYALGGGAALALSCDLRIAAAGTEIGFPEVLLGWNPPWAMARLVRAVGESRALELLMTGRSIDAALAERIGLVNRCVPKPDLAREAESLASILAANPPTAVQAIKQAVRAGMGRSLVEADEIETRAFLECFATTEAREAIRRFVSRGKRKAGPGC